MSTPTLPISALHVPNRELNEIDFGHRMPNTAFSISDPYIFNDSIVDASSRAKALLEMLKFQFVDVEPDYRISDGTIYSVIDTAIREIEDMVSIVYAFADVVDRQAKQTNRHKKTGF